MTHDWQLIGTLLGAAAAIIGVPLSAMVLYLKAIREDQRAFQTQMLQRAAKIEADCDRVDQELDRVRARYTTRDEWMRESMVVRSQLARLTELMARLQAELESSRGLATQFVRATHAIIELADRLGRRLSESGSGCG